MSNQGDQYTAVDSKQDYAWSHKISLADTAVAILLLPFTLLGVVVAIFTLVRDRDLNASIGLSCITFLMAIVTVYAIRGAGLRNIFAPRTSRTTSKFDNGSGIRITTGIGLIRWFGFAISIGSGYWFAIYFAALNGDVTALISPGKAAGTSDSAFLIFGILTFTVRLIHERCRARRR